MSRMTFNRVATAVALIACAHSAQAQLSIDWSTFDGGGAMFTTGGAFELSGTIGQHDAGSFSAPMTGGAFELVGGFWVVAGGCACPGDGDGDCSVTLSDLSLLLAAFGCCSPAGCYLAAADFNSDGCNNLSDLSVLLGAFGATCP
jgi:hypothetical protein